jgi:hypothetical protein
MKAVTGQGKHDARVETVADPQIRDPADAPRADEAFQKEQDAVRIVFQP